MAQLLRTSAFKKIMPTDLSKTVGQTVAEAITNRKSDPEKDKETDSPWPAMPTPIIAAPPPEPASGWPMPLAEFRHGHYLEPGDILLTTRLESFFAFLVKRFDNSRFAHAALTFVTPRHYPGVDRTYLIEATFSGVDLTALSEIVAPTKVYADTKDKPRYVVGIKRLETDWFKPTMRPMVGGRMLRFIKDDDYNFSLLAALAFKNNSYLFKLRDKLFGRSPTVADFLKRSKRFAPVEFICSGFVQYAYVDMVRSAVERGLLPPELAEPARDDVLFAPWASPESSMEDLMAVKPLELAGSPKLKWKYLIYGGLVHKVESEDDVSALFDKINSEKRVVYEA
jgi:hypothetical protein